MADWTEAIQHMKGKTVKVDGVNSGVLNVASLDLQYGKYPTLTLEIIVTPEAMEAMQEYAELEEFFKQKKQ